MKGGERNQLKNSIWSSNWSSLSLSSSSSLVISCSPSLSYSICRAADLCRASFLNWFWKQNDRKFWSSCAASANYWAFLRRCAVAPSFAVPGPALIISLPVLWCPLLPVCLGFYGPWLSCHILLPKILDNATNDAQAQRNVLFAVANRQRRRRLRPRRERRLHCRHIRLTPVFAVAVAASVCACVCARVYSCVCDIQVIICPPFS